MANMLFRLMKPQTRFRSLRLHLTELKAREVKFQLERLKRQSVDHSRTELAEEIRFGELLRSDLQILIFDFPRDDAVWLYALAGLVTLTAASLSLVPLPDVELETALFLRAVSGLVAALALGFYKKRYTSTVFRMMYCTRSREFTIWRLRSLIPVLRAEKIHKDSLLYTADTELNRRRINLINVNTLEGYFADPHQVWLRADLFSHLIKQNMCARSVEVFNKEF